MAVEIVNKHADKMEYILSLPTNKYILLAAKAKYFSFEGRSFRFSCSFPSRKFFSFLTRLYSKEREIFSP